MPNYQKSFIYQIWSPSNPGLSYIGSTTQPLTKRMVDHRSQYKRYLNGTCKTNYSSFQVLACPDARIELIEEVKCENRKQLEAIEGKWIRKKDCVNKCIPGRTKKEYQQQWYQDNKEKCNEQARQYHQDNKQEIKAKMSVKVKCECGSSVQKSNLPRHRRTKKHQQYISQHQQTPNLII